MRVVETRVVGLRLGGMQQTAGLHVELFHLHMRGQGVAQHCVDIRKAREIVAEMAGDERRGKARFESGTRLGG